jgi:hypothetical protein
MGRTIVGGTGVLSMEVDIFDNDLWWWRLRKARLLLAFFATLLMWVFLCQNKFQIKSNRKSIFLRHKYI